MGNESSTPTKTASSDPRTNEISNLIHYAQTHYEENPTDALSALMKAMTLNSGQSKADHAMNRIRSELGSDVADHVMDRTGRMQRAADIVKELLSDETTFLYQQGRQQILQQAMEDGSSLVCTKCNAMVSAARWEQHQTYWCEAIEPKTAGADEKNDNQGMAM